MRGAFWGLTRADRDAVLRKIEEEAEQLLRAERRRAVTVTMDMVESTVRRYVLPAAIEAAREQVSEDMIRHVVHEELRKLVVPAEVYDLIRLVGEMLGEPPVSERR